MLELGQDPSRRLARELCLVEGIPPLYGLLFLENLARGLFHCLGPAGVERNLGRCPRLSQLLKQAQPRSRQRWQEKLRRELSRPYGDEEVFARLRQLEGWLPRALELGEAAWIGGSYAKGHFSAHSDLDVVIRSRDPSQRLAALSQVGLSVFLLPLEPALERVELVLCGPLVKLPLDRSLEEAYWRVLGWHGYEVTPFPRVAAAPERRVRDVPLWLENLFRRSNPKRHRSFFWSLARGVGYRLPGAAALFRQVVPGGELSRPWAPEPDPRVRSLLRLAEESDTPPEYAALARRLAQDPPDWLQVSPGQSAGRLLLAVVRYLGQPSLEWCQAHQAEIARLLRERTLQVNAVRRCAALVAGLSKLAEQHPEEPIELIEFGASAGLLLNFPYYRIDYRSEGEVQVWGPATSSVTLRCRVTGGFRLTAPRVAGCQGLDRRPLDVANADDLRWLRAQSWGSSSLEGALEIARQFPPRLSSRSLEEVLEATSGFRVVFHSHCWNQLSPEERGRLDRCCREAGVPRLSLEWVDALAPLLRLHYPDGAVGKLAACPKGELHWL